MPPRSRLRSKPPTAIKNLTQREAERLRGEIQLQPAAIKPDDAIVGNAASASVPSHTHSTGDISGFSSAVQALIDASDTPSLSTLTFVERSNDPDDPAEGQSVVWQSDGTGAGDDGDIMVKITAGGVTKTITLIDFSAF